MTKLKYRVFYMDTDLLDRALDNCDLGDGYSAKVRRYPHKDMLPELTKVTEYKALTDLQEQCDRLEKALDHYSCSYQQIILTGNEIAVEALAEYRKWKNSTKENE